jgi:hypothetical protein
LVERLHTIYLADKQPNEEFFLLENSAAAEWRLSEKTPIEKSSKRN